MEDTMKRWLIAVMASALLAGTAAAAPAEDEEVSPEERLLDAQRRLEDAAREVAELAGTAAGPRAFREFEFPVRGPRRAMLGVNVGGRSEEHTSELQSQSNLVCRL